MMLAITQQKWPFINVDRMLSSRYWSLAIIFSLLILAQAGMGIGYVTRPVLHLNLYDIGHHYIPPLVSILSRTSADWVWWVGTMSIEVCFAGVILSIAFKGVGMRLGIGLAIIVLFHSLFWHLTTLPVPSNIIWTFPMATGEIAKSDDFWFSGHVGYVTLLALATTGRAFWVRLLSWVYVVIIAVLVLSTRTHYSIDIVGSFFVTYSVYKFLSIGKA